MNEKHHRLKKGTPDDWPSLALLEFTIALARAMKANKEMNQKALADTLGVSPPYISSVMSGNENLTIEQMSRLAEAAGGSLHITIAPRGLRIRWIEDAAQAAREAEVSFEQAHQVELLTKPLPSSIRPRAPQVSAASLMTSSTRHERLSVGTQPFPSQRELVRLGAS